jgi:hypothetical protein
MPFGGAPIGSALVNAKSPHIPGEQTLFRLCTQQPSREWNWDCEANTESDHPRGRFDTPSFPIKRLSTIVSVNAYCGQGLMDMLNSQVTRQTPNAE